MSSDVVAVYERTWAPLIGLLVSMGAERADAEEVAQDAYEKLVRAWPKVRHYDDPGAWVRQVAVRAMISRHRRVVVARAARDRIATPDVADGPADAVARRLDVDAALSELGPEQRAVAVLYYACDLSVEDVAKELDIPIGTVKSRLARARSTLSGRLELSGDEA